MEIYALSLWKLIQHVYIFVDVFLTKQKHLIYGDIPDMDQVYRETRTIAIIA